MNLKSFLQIFGVIAVVMTLVPLIAADYWWIRIFDYLHIQLTLLTLAAIAAYFIRFEIRKKKDYIFIGVLVSCFIFQMSTIFPYLPTEEYEVGKATIEGVEENEIKFYAANVLQKNKNPKLLIREIAEINPDIILLTETDEIWKNAISAAISEYPYRVEEPLDNTYGMLLYSKLKLIEPEVKYLVDKEIPSIHAKIELRSGIKIQLYAIHPTPPMPQHNPSSTSRDAEMMMVAKLSKNSPLPVIIAGDFNDVPWSATSTMFKEVGSVLDTRIGRGFYNSFNSKSFLMRWPLDHFFVTEEFRVKELKLGDGIDSDHFPLLITLSLESEVAAKQKPKPVEAQQLKKANKQIDQAQEEQAKKEEERVKV